MKSGVRRIGGLLVFVVIVVGILTVVGILWHGVSARDEPTVAEAVIARAMRHLAVPLAARRAPNPVTRTDEALAEGRAHFADHCASCHGNDGSGQTRVGRNLYPKAPDMRSPATQSLSDGEIFYIIKNGVRLTGMPAWGDDSPESDASTWHLVHFIRNLPRLTEREIEEMKALNPKTAQEMAEEETERRFLSGEDVAEPHSEHHH